MARRWTRRRVIRRVRRIALAALAVAVVVPLAFVVDLTARYPALEPAKVLAPPAGPDDEAALDIRDVDGVPLLVAHGLPFPTDFDATEHRVESLGGTWLMRLDGAPGDAWTPVAVPSTYNAMRGPLADHAGPVYFKRRFKTALVGSPDHFVRLRFDGVLLRSEVWVNGVRLGAREGGYTPFFFDATAALRRDGGENEILVRADNRPTPASLPPELRPGFEPGWATYGGIYRPVAHERVPRRYVCKAAASAVGAGFEVAVVVHQFENESGTGTGTGTGTNHEIKARLLDPDGVEVAEASARGSRAPFAAYRIVLPAAKPRPYGPGAPALYTIELRLRAAAGTDSTVAFKTGWRRVEVSGERLLWNGAPIFLRGICKHEDEPTLGATPTPALIESDLDLVEDLHANYVRLAHYPHAAPALRAARDRGILISEEIPLYQAGMGFAGWAWKSRELASFPATRFGLRQLHDPALLRNACRQLIEMIERDRNNPAIAFWSAGAENYGLFDGARAAPAFLRDVARRFDPTRPVTVAELTYGAAHLDGRRSATAPMDLVSIDLDPGWLPGEGDDAGPYLDALRAAVGPKPIVISGCGAGAAKSLARAAETRPFVAGVAPWVRAP